MNTICGFPATCPHGTRQMRNSYLASYADGCWTVGTSNHDRLFHLDPDGSRSIAVADYLAAWDEALILNAGDELYDEAARLNEMDRKLREGHWDICGWCGGLAVLDPTTLACKGCGESAKAHVQYLGEVPWSDRVED